MLQAPANPLLPTEWASRTVMNWLLRIGDPLPPTLLWTVAIVAAVAGAVLHRAIYRTAYSKAQESARVDRRQRPVGGLARPGARRGSRRTGASSCSRTRDSSSATRPNGASSSCSACSCVVYLFNIRALPLFSGEQIPPSVITMVVFLNLGLAGFVLAAIAARFLFPAVSLEGRQMWLLRSSPLDLRAMFWSKYWIGTGPLLALALAITIVTNVILRASPFMMLVSVSTMVLFTLAASALALSFGAYYPRFDTENAAQIPTSFGGLIYMMASVLLLGLIISVEAPGVAAAVRREQGGRPLELGADVVLPLLWVALLCASATAGLPPARARADAPHGAVTVTLSRLEDVRSPELANRRDVLVALPPSYGEGETPLPRGVHAGRAEPVRPGHELRRRLAAPGDARRACGGGHRGDRRGDPQHG